MDEEKKPNFLKISVKPAVKREIDIIAASEQRHVYDVVDDMLKLYQAAVAGKPATPSPMVEKKRISDARELIAA